MTLDEAIAKLAELRETLPGDTELVVEVADNYYYRDLDRFAKAGVRREGMYTIVEGYGEFGERSAMQAVVVE